MNVTLTITAESAEELSQSVIELAKTKAYGLGQNAPAEERSIEEMLAELKAKLLPQNLTVVVKNKARDARPGEPKINIIPDEANGAEPEIPEPESPAAEAEEAIEEAETKATATVTKIGTTRKKGVGATKISKDEAPGALNEETPAARKVRCVAKLQALYNDNRKKEVMKILNDLGGGAKAFGAVPEENFAQISDALAAME